MVKMAAYYNNKLKVNSLDTDWMFDTNLDVEKLQTKEKKWVINLEKRGRVPVKWVDDGAFDKESFLRDYVT